MIKAVFQVRSDVRMEDFEKIASQIVWGWVDQDEAGSIFRKLTEQDGYK